MAYTLTEAATATGMSRSTIFRAIKAGRISATRTEGGNFEIEPAELHRVFPPAETHATHANNVAVNRDAMTAATADTGPLAQLESEIKALRDMSALLREQLHETREDRDAWRSQAQAQNLLLARPAADAPAAAPRPWWRRRLVG